MIILTSKIDNIFRSSELKDYWKRQAEMWGDPIKYLPIGLIADPPHGLLLISVQDSDYGKIYYSNGLSREPLFLEANLFLFLESLKPELREDRKEQLNNLYRNWGENFWRIGGDGRDV